MSNMYVILSNFLGNKKTTSPDYKGRGLRVATLFNRQKSALYKVNGLTRIVIHVGRFHMSRIICSHPPQIL
ncbi:hypothetical protein BUY00_04945 [Staphylococcus chromogenes]|nr:hypothetical protein BUY01_06350 [Staphylococcus chromogenes]PTF72664.1 hypothetical protein BUY03_04395 [Staphylococcus chromogenes]PTF76232.1 hypothetical protein BUX97_03580 [Staphylococcus chromogenes]PTG07636.1 hypothetical protein BU648_05755 [Staphylococcus chromogenes]PTG09177.1 hypothetical protein BU647_03215 [Staphylococcus chromogenes]